MDQKRVPWGSKELELYEACRSWKQEAVEKVLKAGGINFTAQDKNGDTVLHLLLQRGHLDAIDPILDQDSLDLTIQNDVCAEVVGGKTYLLGGYTVLHSIMIPGGQKEETVKALVEKMLKKGVPVNAQNGMGQTVLHVIRNKPSVVDLLLRHDANPDIKDNDGKTPGDAVRARYLSIKSANMSGAVVHRDERVDDLTRQWIAKQALALDGVAPAGSRAAKS